MSEQGFIDENGVAGEIRARFVAEQNANTHRVRRGTLALIVVAVHLLVIAWMVSTKIMPQPKLVLPHKTQLLWLLAPRKAPDGVRERIDKPSDLVDQVYKAVQLLDKAPKEERPNAITLDPGLALGQALSCGAGSYEYLTAEGKRRCTRKPWNYTYDRNGFLILRAPNMPPPRREKKLDPRDQMRQQRETAPTCADGAANGGAPCIGNIINGQ